MLLQLFGLAEAGVRAGTGPAIVNGSNDSAGPLLLGWLESRHGRAAAAPVAGLLARRGGNTAGEGMVAIDARGRVHPDQFWHKAVLGDITRQPLAEILEHPLALQLRRRETLLQGRCAACRFLPICRGSHRERAVARHGNMWAADPGCVMEAEEIAPRAAVREAV